jgi:hypothetical protein
MEFSGGLCGSTINTARGFSMPHPFGRRAKKKGGLLAALG